VANKEITSNGYFRDHGATTYSFEGDGDLPFTSEADTIDPMNMELSVIVNPGWVQYPALLEVLGANVSPVLDDLNAPAGATSPANTSKFNAGIN
jgi:hypothetical protein